MNDLIRLRARLTDAYAAGPDRDLGRAEIARVVDLILGHFFWRHFDGGIADFLVQRSLNLLPPGLRAAGEASMRETEIPPPDSDSAIDTLTIAGDPRRIWVEPRMFKTLPSPEVSVTAQDIQQLLADLSAYY